MGEKPADIEREIAARRDAISRKIQDIDTRVRHDVDDIKEKVPTVDSLKEKVPTVSSLKEKVPSMDTLKDKLPEGSDAASAATVPDSYLREHPLALLAAAAGAGFMLDRLFASDSSANRYRGSYEQSEYYAANKARFARQQSASSSGESRESSGTDDDGGFSLPHVPVPGALKSQLSTMIAEVSDMFADEARKLMKEATDALKSELFEKGGDSKPESPAKKDTVTAAAYDPPDSGRWDPEQYPRDGASSTRPSSPSARI